MNIIKLKNNEGYMVQVTKKEALKIIKSLSTQMENESANSGRAEQYTNKGEYFSIAVTE